MSAVSIRQATREDTPAIARIINASWRAAYAGIVPQEVLDALSDEKKQSQLAAGLEQYPKMRYYLLEADGVPAGATCLHPAREEDLPEAGEFSFFYLLPAYWRSGYGTLCSRHVEREAKTHGYLILCCWTLEENARAMRFTKRTALSATAQNKR